MTKFKKFYSKAYVYQEANSMYIVTDGKEEIVVHTEHQEAQNKICYKILSHNLKKAWAEKIFDLVDEFIAEQNKPKSDYDIKDEQALYGYGY